MDNQHDGCSSTVAPQRQTVRTVIHQSITFLVLGTQQGRQQTTIEDPPVLITHTSISLSTSTTAVIALQSGTEILALSFTVWG